MRSLPSQFTIRFAPNCIDVATIPAALKAKLDAQGKFPISTILLDRVKAQVNMDITKHQLYYGPPGLGKSTVAAVRLSDPKYSMHFINCSKDGRIDELRTSIENFCTTSAISEDGQKQTKVVVMDEIDGVSTAFADGLRGFMDTYEKNVMFLATANYINRIPPAIQSRFNPCINFAPLNQEESKELFEKYKKRLKQIWTGPTKIKVGDHEVNGMLGRKTSEEAIHALAVKTGFDIRSGMQNLQTLHDTIQGELTLNNLVAGITNFRELWDFIFTPGIDEAKIHYKLSVEYADKGHEVIASMHSQLVDYVIEKYPDLAKLIGPINILSAKYLSAPNIDPLLALKACVFELSTYLAKVRG